MPGLDSIHRAALNNARWCDAVCRAHGRPGKFSAELWVNRHAVPPLYPNAVTLTAEGVDEQMRAVADLDRASVADGWAVKDSFSALDLSKSGFRILFDAQWIVREASAPLPDANLRCELVSSENDLVLWERAWRAAPGNQLPQTITRLFPAPLLAEPEVAFIAIYRESKIVAGCIANRSDVVAGITNMFLPAENAAAHATACIAAVTRAFPGLPIVAYEQNPAASRALGFESIGPLRIWSRLRG